MKKLFWSKQKVIKTIWPYREGYGTYRINILTRNRQILDTGLSKNQAKAECKKT